MIFYLSKDPRKAAEFQCDYHVRSSLLFYLWCLRHIWEPELYMKDFCYNERVLRYCKLWCCRSIENYDWLLESYKALFDEYRRRSGTQRKKKERMILVVKARDRIKEEYFTHPEEGFTAPNHFFLGSPGRYLLHQNPDMDPVEAHRQNYIKEYVCIMCYSNTPIPFFLKGKLRPRWGQRVHYRCDDLIWRQWSPTNRKFLKKRWKKRKLTIRI